MNIGKQVELDHWEQESRILTQRIIWYCVGVVFSIVIGGVSFLSPPPWRPFSLFALIIGLYNLVYALWLCYRQIKLRQKIKAARSSN
jgi:hypothetical protein